MPTATELHHTLVFQNELLPAGAARVIRMDAREALSRPFAIDVDLEILGAEVEPREFLMNQAEILVLAGEDATLLRRFAGLVTRVVEVAGRGAVETPEAQAISVTLESQLAILRLFTDRRIFQEKTTREIADEILSEVGIRRVEWRLANTYKPREVCTQLDETTFDFLSRILEEDGIFYFAEHSDEGEKIIFGDSSAAFSATEPAEEVPFRAASGLASEQAIMTIGEATRARPAKVTLRDHDFKKPSLKLEGVAEDTDAALGREHYDYPGRFIDPDEGSRRAELRLNALKLDAERVTGTGTVFSLRPGHTFSLVEAPDSALDREWVVAGIDHAWTQKTSGVEFENRFELLPADASFRARARTPRAVVPGPQLAVVSGPAGEEIHTDEHGRVKVHFHWDRRSQMDDKSSSWVRVGQMQMSGSVVIPRVGWEVIVDFEDGDPDRPIVVGRVYNPSSPPPYALPGKKTMSALKSTSSPGKGGYNEIRMDDGAGAEHMQVYAQKDQNVVVGNDKTQKVATSATEYVGSDHKLTVGGNETVSVGAQRELTIGGSQSVTVGGSRTKTVGADEAITVKGSRVLTIGGSHTTMTPMSVSTTTPAALSETVGGSCIEIAALESAMLTAGVASVTVGGAKIEAVATGKSDMTLGARASTVGGAFISASGKDVNVSVGGAKATSVGGVFAANSGGVVAFEADGNLMLNVGGIVMMNGAKVVLKVGGSSVTLSGGSVVLKSSTIKLTATGPQPELAAMVSDK